MASKIDTISNALILIGDKPLNSLAEGSYRSTVAANLYDSTYEAELSTHTWFFARRVIQLAKLPDPPLLDKWQSQYQLPPDMITLIKIDPRIDYELYGDKMYTNGNTQKFVLDYIAKVPESTWPDYFKELMQFALAYKFAIPIRENTSTQQAMYQLYQGQGQKARATDSKQKIQRPIQDAPYLFVRE